MVQIFYGGFTSVMVGVKASTHRAAVEGWGSTQNRAIELHVRALSYIRTAERYESCITLPFRSGHAIECDPIDATRSARRTPAHVVVSKLLLDFVSDLISLTPLPVCRFNNAKIDTFLNFSLVSLAKTDGDP